MDVKQVIVVRKDLKMPKGKIASQVAHASLGATLKLMDASRKNGVITRSISYRENGIYGSWLDGKFTKVILAVNSEKELLDLKDQAYINSINFCLIEDCGDTIFNGIPTKTCLALGPDMSIGLDRLTSHLPLL